MMKKIICILVFIFPVVTFAQQPWFNDSLQDPGWKYVGNAAFSAGVAYDVSLRFNPSDSLPYVAYQDRNLFENITVMKFNGTHWVNVGNAGFSTDFPEYVSLAFSPSDGFPYVAYSDGIGGFKARVMKFNGTKWVNVGNTGQGFSAGEADYVSLAFNPADNQPYVAYKDYGNANKATVMTYNGTRWVNVGNAGFSAGETDNECLAFNPYDYQPYVAYMDYVSSGISVMTFNGTNWVNIGTAGFYAGSADYISLAINPSSGLPYVAFADRSIALKATVMMFDGTNWVYVGNAGFSTSLAQYENIAFGPRDAQPYVAYADSAGLATLMKFNGTNWVSVGKKGFSPGVVYFPSLDFSPADKQPYVAFEDAVTGFASVMKYDSVVGLNELIQSKLSLYPNPAHSTVYVSSSGALTHQNGSLTLYDIRGLLLLTKQVGNETTGIDVSGLKPGVYFVRFSDNTMTRELKFIKN
ncbi:MAG: T9SS type A sorting domain-containing protein [bacterium]